MLHAQDSIGSGDSAGNKECVCPRGAYILVNVVLPPNMTNQQPLSPSCNLHRKPLIKTKWLSSGFHLLSPQLFNLFSSPSKCVILNVYMASLFFILQIPWKRKESRRETITKRPYKEMFEDAALHLISLGPEAFWKQKLGLFSRRPTWARLFIHSFIHTASI